ncbi:hypothetical protein BLSTO_03175 [Blastocystis sp. subtype 1]
MGATNRPFELDDAVIRRMARRIYIPLPDEATRYELFKILLKKQKVDLSKEDMVAVLRKSELYSGSDIKVLCKEAAMGPIREVTDLMSIDASKIRPIQMKDFEEAFRVCAPSVSQSSLKQYITWNDNFGSKGEEPSENVETEIKGISSAKDLCRSRSVGICVTPSFPKQLQTKLIEYETAGSMMIKESRSLRTSCFHVLIFESQSFLFDGGVIPFLSWHQDHLFQLRPRAWGLLVDG